MEGSFQLAGDTPISSPCYGTGDEGRLERKTKRAAVALAFVLLLTGAALLVYPYVAGPPLKQSLSFNIDWPTTAYTTNVLAYNGSMHIDLFVFSNGSVTQGKEVTAAAVFREVSAA
jgi:hypothetical protein